MGALVGLGVGVGLLLVWSAFSLPMSPRRPRPATGGAVGRLLARAGLGSVRPTAFLGLCGVLGVTAALLLQLVSGTPPVAVAFGVLAAYLPVAVVRGRARRRQREFAEVWPEAVDNLASAVRAGLSLPDALAALGTRGPEPLRPAFGQFALDYQVTGRFSDCLDRLKDRLADPVGDRVVEGLRIAREVGAASSAGCCATCRATCATTCAPEPRWSRARRGRSTGRGSRWLPRGWCCCSCRSRATWSGAMPPPPGSWS
ncbi:MAG: type II secretion system protein F [Nocardioides sp.]